MILAADIGASNSRLGIYRRHHEAILPVFTQKFQNRNYASFNAVLDDFEIAPGQLTAACFGIAGPIFDGRGSITNLPWEFDVAYLRERLSVASISLINDVEATGYGAGLLSRSELLTLNEGEAHEESPAALIAAGTGLGETILLRTGRSVLPLPTEAGHADFAPNTELESELLLHLRKRFGHISLDRVLSGPGLRLIYDFLMETGRGSQQDDIGGRFSTEDAGAVIAETALNRSSAAAMLALDIFASIYGAEAGNLALRALARGGVYLGGGIAPKIREKLVDGVFMRGFTAKGRMAPMLETIPVHVILNEDTALLGAAYYAATQGRQNSGS